MSADRNKVGEGFVEISAKTDKLSAGLEDAKQQTQEATESMALGAKKAVDGFRKMTGTVTAGIGIFTAFYNIGRKIGEMFESTSDKAEKLSNSMNFADPAARISELTEELSIVEAQIAQKQEGGFIERILGIKDTAGALLKGKGLMQALEEEQKELQGRINSANEQTQGKEREKRRKAEEDVLEQIAARQRSIAIALAEDEQRILLEKAEAVRKIDEQLAVEQRDRVREALEQEKQAVEELFSFRIQRFRDEQAEKARIEREREQEAARRQGELADRQAAALERSLTRAIDQANKRTEALIGRLTVAAESIGRVVRDIDSARGRR